MQLTADAISTDELKDKL